MAGKNYKITAPDGGTLTINMDHEPTDDELDTIFEKEKQKKGMAPPLPGPQLPAALDVNKPNPMPSGVAGLKASLFPTDQDIKDRDARVAYDVQHTPVHPPNLPTGQDIKSFITNPNHIAAALTAAAPKTFALPINAANVGRAAYNVYQHPSFKGPETTDLLQSLQNFMMGGLSVGGLQEPSIPSNPQVGTGPIVQPPSSSIIPPKQLGAARPPTEAPPIDVPFTPITQKVLAPGTPPESIPSSTPTPKTQTPPETTPPVKSEKFEPSTLEEKATNREPTKLTPKDIENIKISQKILKYSSNDSAALAKLKEEGKLYNIRNENYNPTKRGQEPAYKAVAHTTPINNLWLRSADNTVLKEMYPGAPGDLQKEIGVVLMERGEMAIPITPKSPPDTMPKEAPRYTKYIQQRD